MPITSLPATNPSSAFADMRGHHVALRVPDFEASKKWFVEKLDFRVIHEWPFGELHLAYLAPATDDAFWIELLGDHSPIPQPAYADLSESLEPEGYHHFCINVSDIDATVAELKRREVNVIGETIYLEAIGRRLAFFADPWGNVIELAQVVG
jgi:catechol 2,3-dioxygenase-like lactoylglutathione lyase family enzyme